MNAESEYRLKAASSTRSGGKGRTRSMWKGKTTGCGLCRGDCSLYVDTNTHCVYLRVPAFICSNAARRNTTGLLDIEHLHRMDRVMVFTFSLLPLPFSF